MEPKSLFDLFLCAREGNRLAFDQMVDRFSDGLRLWIRGQMGAIVRASYDVEDVFQPTCLRAFLSIGRIEWRGELAFIHWLKMIAKHDILNKRRREEARKRNHAIEVRLDDGGDSSTSPGVSKPVNPPDPRAESPSKLMERLERSQRVKRVWKALPSHYRLVLKRARIDGLPIKEIAKRLGRSPDAISMLLLRAARAFGELYGPGGSSLRLPTDCELDTLGNGEGPAPCAARLRPRPPQPPGSHARPTETRMEAGRRVGDTSSSLLELPSVT